MLWEPPTARQRRASPCGQATAADVDRDKTKRRNAVLARDDRNTPVDWVARATALVPMIAAASDRIEAERRIVPEVIAALHEAGLFRMLLPASFGGGGADVPGVHP